MAKTGSKSDYTEQQMWDYFLGKGLNEYGVAGLFGNLYKESGLSSNNLQNTGNTKLDMTDAEYTSAVDDGSYTNFVKDGYGYGLAQWTYYTRKQNLKDYADDGNYSIGSRKMQCKFLYKELKESYSSVLKTLKSATSVSEASNAVLLKYEKPADTSTSVQEARTKAGEKYYKKYASSEATSTDEDDSTTSTEEINTSLSAGAKLILKNCPLYANSTTATKSNTLTGTYYLWGTTKTNGRYKITNKKANAGVSGQVTGWVDASYVEGSSSTSSSSSTTTTIKAGLKLTLKSCPLYASSTATKKSNTVTGTYYLWDATKKNSRYRITNKKSNVGVSGQVTGWISSTYVS